MSKEYSNHNNIKYSHILYMLALVPCVVGIHTQNIFSLSIENYYSMINCMLLLSLNVIWFEYKLHLTLIYHQLNLLILAHIIEVFWYNIP